MVLLHLGLRKMRMKKRLRRNRQGSRRKTKKSNSPKVREKKGFKCCLPDHERCLKTDYGLAKWRSLEALTRAVFEKI